MTGWDPERQRWEHRPGPDTGRSALEAGLRIAAAALTVAVLATVGVGGGRLLFREDPQQAGAAAEATPGETATTGTTAGTDSDTAGTDTASPGSGMASATAGEPPPGFVVREDAEGFTVQVREDWQRRAEQRDEGVVVYYETSDKAGLLQIYQISEPDYTPYDALVETDRLQSANDGYERLSLERENVSDGSAAAELSYRLPRRDGTVRRSLLRAFVADDGVRWVVLVAGPENEWDTTYAESAGVAAASFCPLGYCPPTP
ncbi:hypothetical protein AB0P17_28985 [Streptomyces sp. NPDC088124]|uniref:hypothetical protein n=1 Tax=Streptomyces sp. NPDC088124 TaxID=3154654 RepID=UPI003429501C